MPNKIILVAFCLLITPLTEAGRIVYLPQKVDIVRIHSYHGGYGFFVKVVDVGYWEGCQATQRSGIYYLPQGSRNAYKMLLLAKSLNQPVLLAVTGYDGCHGGSTGYAKIHEVQFGNW